MFLKLTKIILKNVLHYFMLLRFCIKEKQWPLWCLVTYLFWKWVKNLNKKVQNAALYTIMNEWRLISMSAWIVRIRSVINNPAIIYLFKVNNISTRKRCEICSKLTLKIPQRCHWRCSSVFYVNFENIPYLFILFSIVVYCGKCYYNVIYFGKCLLGRML